MERRLISIRISSNALDILTKKVERETGKKEKPSSVLRICLEEMARRIQETVPCLELVQVKNVDDTPFTFETVSLTAPTSPLLTILDKVCKD